MVYFYIYIKTAREFGHEKLARHLIFFFLDQNQTKIAHIKLKIVRRRGSASDLIKNRINTSNNETLGIDSRYKEIWILLFKFKT